jgi:hypothetical protein
LDDIYRDYLKKDELEVAYWKNGDCFILGLGPTTFSFDIEEENKTKYKLYEKCWIIGKMVYNFDKIHQLNLQKSLNSQDDMLVMYRRLGRVKTSNIEFEFEFCDSITSDVIYNMLPIKSKYKVKGGYISLSIDSSDEKIYCEPNMEKTSLDFGELGYDYESSKLKIYYVNNENENESKQIKSMNLFGKLIKNMINLSNEFSKDDFIEISHINE